MPQESPCIRLLHLGHLFRCTFRNYITTALAAFRRHVKEVWMPTVETSLPEKFHFELVNLARCNKNYSECDLYYPIAAL